MKGKTLQPLQKTHGDPVPLLYGLSGVGVFAKWLRGQDLNLRPLGYEAQDRWNSKHLRQPRIENKLMMLIKKQQALSH